MNLTDETIEQAKADMERNGFYSLAYGSGGKPHHEHPDCIRLAYQWLDAQKKTKGANMRQTAPIKHAIERWAGRYISTNDVEVAAYLHPEVHGRYPCYNLSQRLIWPNERRLEGIGEARTQNYQPRPNDNFYSSDET
jgi:hypothetical protein